MPWPIHASSPMTTIRVPPATVRSRDRTGLVTTTPLYCSTPLIVIETRYESRLARPAVIAPMSNDGMAPSEGMAIDGSPADAAGACEAGAAEGPLPVPTDLPGVAVLVPPIRTRSRHCTPR